MKNWHRAALILLLVALGFLGFAYTQSDLIDDGAPVAPQSTSIVPSNPVQQVYEDGKVIVVMGVNSPPRNYGFRTGDRIPVRILIAAEPDVKIDVNSILHKMLVQDGSGMEFAAAPKTSAFWMKGRNVTVIDAPIRFWVIKPDINFQANFLYALNAVEGGKPNWVPATTPQLPLSTSNTATDNSKDLQDGSLEPQSSPHPTPVGPLRALGILLLLFPIGYTTWLIYRRLYPPRVVPANEIAWQTFDRVLDSATEEGISYERTQELASAFRTYLGIEATPESQVTEKLEQFYAGTSKRFEMARVAEEALAILAAALYKRPADTQTVTLKRDAARDLFLRLDRLVPQP